VTLRFGAVAQVVFLLGAGFNCSILDPSHDSAAPLASNFFQVFLADRRTSLDLFRQHVFVDILLEEIERYWHLDLDGLRTEPFDIEECLTLFESQADDAGHPAAKVRLLRAAFALQQMLLGYLAELRYGGHTPTAQQFGSEVLAAGADVLTFNYDSLAEEAIRVASGIGPKPMPPSLRTNPIEERRLADDDLDASHFKWKPGLALGFQFDEIALPIAGVSQFVEGARYYAHAENQLYSATRVLKLHGSTDWLRYTDQRRYPPFEGERERQPGRGIVLEPIPSYRFGETPSRDVWQMEPIVIPPLLYKRFDQHPLPTIWETALETLSECHTLVVIGYSFPPTDFRTRRLFLEAFSKPHLRNLVVINPDPAIAGIVRQLTHFKGAVVTCDDLRSLYGLPASWFDLVPTPAAPPDDPRGPAKGEAGGAES
jgi:hypothetical protein